jgi:multidrug transporter EmrE-like cation transporter
MIDIFNSLSKWSRNLRTHRVISLILATIGSLILLGLSYALIHTAISASPVNVNNDLLVGTGVAGGFLIAAAWVFLLSG